MKLSRSCPQTCLPSISRPELTTPGSPQDFIHLFRTVMYFSETMDPRNQPQPQVSLFLPHRRMPISLFSLPVKGGLAVIQEADSLQELATPAVRRDHIVHYPEGIKRQSPPSRWVKCFCWWRRKRAKVGPTQIRASNKDVE